MSDKSLSSWMTLQYAFWIIKVLTWVTEMPEEATIFEPFMLDFWYFLTSRILLAMLEDASHLLQGSTET